MQGAIEILQTVGVFFTGLLARVGVFIAMLAVLVVPALVIALVIRAVSARRQRALGSGGSAGCSTGPTSSTRRTTPGSTAATAAPSSSASTTSPSGSCRR